MSTQKNIPSILRRQLNQMLWVDPKQVLVNLRYLELHLPSQIDNRVRRLRTNELKEWHEARHAALFAFGISDKVLKTPVLVSKSQDRDFDFVIRWQVDRADYFYPAQLKELVPDDLNADLTLADIFGKLKKYSGSQDLSVVISLNRREKVILKPWGNAEKPRIRELWYLGCESFDQTRWFLYGDVLANNPKKYEFRYPEGDPNFG